jgi:Tryptophan-associated transmembrane protein (Trp_oprn_chp)
MPRQRQLGSAVVACLAGAALVLYGATRVWSEQVTERPGLTSLHATTTGATRAPWLVGLALVALAGAGALPATRGLPRRLLGGLLAVAGIGAAVAAVAGRLGLDAGTAGAGAALGPLACVLGGALAAWGGLTAARHGHRWPTMGSRYERRTVPSPASPPGAGPGPSAAAGLNSSAPPRRPDPAPADATARPTDHPTAPAGTDTATARPVPADRPDAAALVDRPDAAALVDTKAAWDALDRGDDPTAP